MAKRIRFVKHGIAPSSHFMADGSESAGHRKRKSYFGPSAAQTDAPIEPVRPQVELPEPAIAPEPPEIASVPPPSPPSPEATRPTEPMAGPGMAVCQWCGCKVETPERHGYMRPFVVNGEAHFFHHRRGVPKKAAPPQAAPPRPPSTWAEVLRRSEDFWRRYYARRMSEAA